jgi:hypothetical protein
MLDSSERKFFKPEVIIFAVKILAEVWHKYEDAAIYMGDLLNVMETDFDKIRGNTGYAYFYSHLQQNKEEQYYIM